MCFYDSDRFSPHLFLKLYLISPCFHPHLVLFLDFIFIFVSYLTGHSDPTADRHASPNSIASCHRPSSNDQIKIQAVKRRKHLSEKKRLPKKGYIQLVPSKLASTNQLVKMVATDIIEICRKYFSMTSLTVLALILPGLRGVSVSTRLFRKVFFPSSLLAINTERTYWTSVPCSPCSWLIRILCCFTLLTNLRLALSQAGVFSLSRLLELNFSSQAKSFL